MKIAKDTAAKKNGNKGHCPPFSSPLFVRSFISSQAIKMNILLYFGVMVVASCLIRLWLWLSIVLLVFRKMLIFRHRVSQARARSTAGLGTRPCTRSTERITLTEPPRGEFYTPMLSEKFFLLCSREASRATKHVFFLWQYF